MRGCWVTHPRRYAPTLALIVVLNLSPLCPSWLRSLAPSIAIPQANRRQSSIVNSEPDSLSLNSRVGVAKDETVDVIRGEEGMGEAEVDGAGGLEALHLIG